MTTKAAVTLLASQSLAAATAIDTPETNISDKDGFKMIVRFTNGSTAPTTAPKVIFYAGPATGVKRKMWEVTGDTVNSSINDRSFRFDKEDLFANATITWGNTTGGTIEAYGETYIK